VTGDGWRVAGGGGGWRVAGGGWRVAGGGVAGGGAAALAGCGLRVPGRGLRVAGWGPGLRVAGSGLRVAGCGLRAPDSGRSSGRLRRVAGCGFRVRRVPGCGLRVAGSSGFRRVAGCGLRVAGRTGRSSADDDPLSLAPPFTFQQHQTGTAAADVIADVNGRVWLWGTGRTHPVQQYGAYADFALLNNLITPQEHKTLHKAYLPCKLAAKSCGEWPR